MEALVGGEVGDLDAQQVLDRAGDVVALDDLGGGGDGALEGLLRRLGVRRRGPTAMKAVKPMPSRERSSTAR